MPIAILECVDLLASDFYECLCCSRIVAELPGPWHTCGECVAMCKHCGRPAEGELQDCCFDCLVYLEADQEVEQGLGIDDDDPVNWPARPPTPEVLPSPGRLANDIDWLDDLPF